LANGAWITPHFKRSELECHCGCGEMPYTEQALEYLEELRCAAGFNFIVNSGFRCPAHNDRVSSTGLMGPHTQWSDDNIVVDLKVFGADAYNLIDLAQARAWSGIGVKQKGHFPGRFIHLDRLQPGSVKHPRPRLWSY